MELNKSEEASQRHSSSRNSVVITFEFIPIIKTIETLNEVREGRADVDLTEVIRTLTDSVALIDSDNVGLVTMRKALIKADLPDNLKPICAKDTEFTPELLFGEDLLKQVKDLGETTKLFGDLKRKSVQFGTRRGRLNSHGRLNSRC